MADLTFGERYEQDTNFKEAVDQFRHELVLVAFGIDPDQLIEAWDGRRLNLDAADFGGYGPSAGPIEFVADGWQEEEEEEEEEEVVIVNPVADLSAEDAKGEIEEATAAEDERFLIAIRDQDDRVTVVMDAARSLFDLRTQE